MFGLQDRTLKKADRKRQTRFLILPGRGYIIVLDSWMIMNVSKNPFFQQTQFFTRFLPWKAAKVHKQPSKSTGGSKRQSDSPSNQGVNIPIAGHNALASLKKNAWKLYINSIWCYMMSQISWSHHFRPLSKNLSCLEPFSHCHSFALFFSVKPGRARKPGSQ